MAAESETPYVHGNYDKLAPELWDLVDAQRKAHANPKSYSAVLDLDVATQAFEDASREKFLELASPPIADTKLTELTSYIESYGVPEQQQVFDELLVVGEQLTPGAFVRNAVEVYQLDEREPVITIGRTALEQLGVPFLRGSIQWIAFGTEVAKPDEIVGFPVTLASTIGAEAISTQISKWQRDIIDRGKRPFILKHVRKNVLALEALGEIDAAEKLKGEAATQARNDLLEERTDRDFEEYLHDFELLNFTNPEGIQEVLDAKARSIAASETISAEDVAFYEARIAHNLPEGIFHDPRYRRPLATLELYKAEFLRGRELLATDKQ